MADPINLHAFPFAVSCSSRVVVKPFLSALPSARRFATFRLVDLSQLSQRSTLSCRDLRTDTGGDPYDAPAALLMHGNEANQVFCYANRTA